MPALQQSQQPIESNRSSQKKQLIYRNASSFYGEMTQQVQSKVTLQQQRQKSSFLKYLTDKSLFTDKMSKKVSNQRTKRYNPLTGTDKLYYSTKGEKPEKREDSLFDKQYKYTLSRNPSAFRKSSGDFEKSIDNKNVLQKFLRNNKPTIEKEDSDE